MDIEAVRTAQKKAIAEAIAGGMTEELANSIFGGMLTTVETEAAKDTAKLEDFDKVVRQREEAKERVRAGEDAAIKLKKLEDEGKSEVEVLQARVTELEPHEATSTALTSVVQGIYDDVVKELPDAVKATIPEDMSLDKRLALARSFKEAIGAPGPGPGGELPAGGSGSTIKRSDYNALGSDGNLDAWSTVKKQVASGEKTIVEDT